jgi:hypothetical protein
MHFLAYVADSGAVPAIPLSDTEIIKDESHFTSSVLGTELSTLNEVCAIDFNAVDIAIKDLDKGITLLRKELGLWQLSGRLDRRGDTVSAGADVTHPGVSDLKYFAHLFAEEVYQIKEFYDTTVKLGKDVLIMLGETPPSSLVKKDDNEKKNEVPIGVVMDSLKIISEIKRSFALASKDNVNAQNVIRRNKLKEANALKAKEAAAEKLRLAAEATDKIAPMGSPGSGRSRKFVRGRAPPRDGGRLRNSSSGGWEGNRRTGGGGGGLLGALSRMRLDIAGDKGDGESSSEEEWNSDDE